MPSLWGRVTAAVGAFARAWAGPTEARGFGAVGADDHLGRLLAYYRGDAFEDAATWGPYVAKHGLYTSTRAIYNPVRRLCDFYAGQVYSGILSEDGARLPDGVPLAVPLAEDTDPALRAAIAQVWQWSNWQAQKSVFVRYGAIAGSVLVEVDDDAARGKVALRVVWPGLVDPAFLALDAAGNVKRYAVQYWATDPDRAGARYRYRKEVTRETFAYFRDGQPFDYDGFGAVQPNPYGFAPAVWAKHADVGGDWGAPAIDGSLGKVDELNSLASHVHDQIHKKIAAPALLPGVNVTSLAAAQAAQAAQAATRRGLLDEYGQATIRNGRDELLLIGAPAGSDVKSLAGTLELADALPYLERLLGEIEQDHPELALYRELRAMQQVTGPGAQQLLGDAAARVAEAQAGYDRASIALFGMAVAVGGWRLATGGWEGATNRQQAKFAGFDLASYEAGALDFAIMPRPLVVATALERLAQAQARGAAVSVWVAAGLPLPLAVAQVDGLPPDAPEIAALAASLPQPAALPAPPVAA